MRLFADNNGLVTIHNKPIAIPAGLDLTVAGTSKATTDISFFVTGFSETKSSQYQVKQSIDNQFHILPFGQQPAMISITGVTFGRSQYDGKPLEDFTPAESELDTEAGDAADKDEKTTLSEKIKAISPAKWVDKLSLSVTTSAVGLKDKLAGNSVVGALKGGVSVVGNVVGGAINAVASVGGLVSAVKGFIFGVAPGPPLPPTVSTQAQPLSFPELHGLFTVMETGSRLRASEGHTLMLKMAEMAWKCTIDSIKFTADTRGVITFSMTLRCHNKQNKRGDQYAGVVYRATSSDPASGILGSLGLNTPGAQQAVRALGAAAAAQVRGSDLSVGNVSLGRLI